MRFLTLFVAISTWTGVALAQLPVFPTVTVNLPVFGLASSETAQVNVVYFAFTPQTATAPSATSCSGTVTFYNASGSAIGNPASFSINAGQIYSATLPYSEVTGTSGSARTAVRATVAAPCSLNTNIETYDTATGVTHVHVEGSSAGIFGFVRPITTR